jgi:uncharacterized OB-fold protein
MAKLPTKVEETMEAGQVFRIPMPLDLAGLDKMSPLVVKQPYNIVYVHSYGQDSPFFAGLTNGRFLSTRCPRCKWAPGTPRGHCMRCGTKMKWVELPKEAVIHSFTVCYFGSEAFLDQCPYVLVMIEWPGVDTLFLGRLFGVDPEKPDLSWIGKKVKLKFLRKAKISPTDVYFVLADDAPAKAGGAKRRKAPAKARVAH